MRESTVAASLLIDVCGYLDRHYQISSSQLCYASGMNPEILRRPNDRVSGATAERFWKEAEELSRNTHLGLSTAANYNPGALNILGYVLASCATAQDAMLALARYAALLNDGLQVRLETNGDQLLCILEAVTTIDNFLLRSPRQIMEAMALGIAGTLTRLTVTQVTPVAILFRHPRPQDTSAHEQTLGSQVHFSQTCNAVVYRQQDVGASLLSANLELLEYFDIQAAKTLERLEGQGAVSRRVLNALATGVKGRLPLMGEIATELAMSRRNLQRALRREGTTFRAVVERLLCEIAVHQMKNQGSTATDVALLLGFSDPSAFSRAFKRWTGTVPSAYVSTR